MTDATTITPQRNTLSKSERVASRNTVETLFGGGHSRALSAFPLRMVYMLAPRAEGEPAAQMLVSVPKRWFKRAVKRNRIKRQVREAYRTSKHQLLADIAAGRKYMKVYRQMKMYNDPSTNPVLYKK